MEIINRIILKRNKMFQAEMFLEDIRNRSLVYKGSNIAVAFGDDFNYQAAGVNFNNLDLLIK